MSAILRGRASSRTLALVGVVAAAAVASWHLPSVLRRLDNGVAAAAGRSAVERQLPAAAKLGIDPAALVEARRLIPPAATFAVAAPKGASDLSSLAFPGLAANELLPRRRTAHLDRAQWVLAYRIDPRSLGLRLAHVRRLSKDVVLAEVVH